MIMFPCWTISVTHQLSPVSRPAQPAVSPRLHTFAALIWGDTRTPSEDADWQRPISSPLIDTKNYADKVLYFRGQIQMQTRTRVSTPCVALCPNGFSFEFYWCLMLCEERFDCWLNIISLLLQRHISSRWQVTPSTTFSTYLHIYTSTYLHI